MSVVETNRAHPDAMPAHTKLYCNVCHHQTNHNAKARHILEFGEYGPYTGWEILDHCLYICAGSEMVTFVVHCYSSSNHFGPHATYYPKRVSGDLNGKIFHKLPSKLHSLYFETIEAFNNGCLLLCTAGLRALLEGICDDKQTGGSTLENKIDRLQSLLPNSNIINHLHGFRFTGNEALHDLSAMTSDEAKIAIEVIEDLMNFLYELDYKSSQVKHATKRLLIP